MSLINLVKAGQLKQEPFSQQEFLGLFNSGKIRLKDFQGVSSLNIFKFFYSRNSFFTFPAPSLCAPESF
jgi:hypothetical protein